MSVCVNVCMCVCVSVYKDVVALKSMKICPWVL